MASSCDLDRTSSTSSPTPKPTSPMVAFGLTLCGKDGSDTTARNTPPCCARLLNRLSFAFQSVRPRTSWQFHFRKCLKTSHSVLRVGYIPSPNAAFISMLQSEPTHEYTW